MYVLGIETATLVASVAVSADDVILAERLVNNKKTHSVNLMPMIRSVIEEAGIASGELNGVAVSSGPGSFTGLRIGMSTAKTLAQVWGLPVVGISTLEAMAFPLSGHGNLICPVLNARKNEVYTAVYDGLEGHPRLMAGPMAVKPDHLVKLLDRWEARKITFLGDGVHQYREEFLKIKGSRVFFAPGSASLPRGAAVAELGCILFKAGHGREPLDLLPEYIRLSEAEIKWQQRHKESMPGPCPGN